MYHFSLTLEKGLIVFFVDKISSGTQAGSYGNETCLKTKLCSKIIRGCLPCVGGGGIKTNPRIFRHHTSHSDTAVCSAQRQKKIGHETLHGVRATSTAHIDMNVCKGVLEALCRDIVVVTGCLFLCLEAWSVWCRKSHFRLNNQSAAETTRYICRFLAADTYATRNENMFHEITLVLATTKNAWE